MTVTGTLLDIEGAAAGVIVFRRTKPERIGTDYYPPGELRETTGSDGTFSIVLTYGTWEMIWLQSKAILVTDESDDEVNWTEIATEISYEGMSSQPSGGDIGVVTTRAALKALPDTTTFLVCMITEPEEAGLATWYRKTVDGVTAADDISIIASNGGGLRWFAVL